MVTSNTEGASLFKIRNYQRITAVDYVSWVIMASIQNYEFLCEEWGLFLLKRSEGRNLIRTPHEASGYKNNPVAESRVMSRMQQSNRTARVVMNNHMLVYVTTQNQIVLYNMANNSQVSTTTRNYLLTAMNSQSITMGATTNASNYVFYVGTTNRTSNVQNYVDRTKLTQCIVNDTLGRVYVSNNGFKAFSLSTGSYLSSSSAYNMGSHPALISKDGEVYAFVYNTSSTMFELYEVNAVTTYSLVDPQQPISQMPVDVSVNVPACVTQIEAHKYSFITSY